MGKDEIKNQGRFYKLPVEIAARRDLPASAKIILGVIAGRMGQNKTCWPGMRCLERDSGLTRPTVINNIEKLKAKRMLKIEDKGRGRRNRYSLPKAVKKLYHLEAKTGQETLPLKEPNRSRNFTT